MKLLKSILVLALVLTNVAPALAYTEITSAPVQVLSAVTLDVTDGCILLTRAWDLNDSDAEITALSRYLKQQGFYKGSVTSKFTKALKTSLGNFQLSKGIIKNKNSDVLGVVTAPTREHISEATCKKRDLDTAGSCVYLIRNVTVESNQNPVFREDILKLQRFLVQKGYMSSTFVTGTYGPILREALTRFQYDNGIIASKTQEGAGNAGPKTREFIQLNTCGKNDVAKTTDAKQIGFIVQLATRTGVKVDSSDTEQVLSLKVKPQEQNAQLNHLTVQIETASSTNPADYIDGVELFMGGRIISRTRGANIWTPVSGVANNYTVKLNGSTELLSRGEEFTLSVKIAGKSTAFTLNPKEFKISIPQNGLNMQFSNANGVVKGDETWGAPTQKGTFSVGKPEVVVPPTTGTTTTSTNGTTTIPTTPTTPTVVVTQTPQLNIVNPSFGPYGSDINLRGKYFSTTSGNKVKLTHVRTGVTTEINVGPASASNLITFRFPGKGREFKRPNGNKVTPNQIDLTGNYRVSVTSNGKTSNWLLFKVNQ